MPQRKFAVNFAPCAQIGIARSRIRLLVQPIFSHARYHFK